MTDQHDDDADLKAAYAPQPSGTHVSDETWEAFLEGSLASSARTAVADHLVTCRRCAEIFRGLKTFQREAAAFDPAASGRTRAVRSAFPVWIPALAAGL